jgi:hypothetical protein
MPSVANTRRSSASMRVGGLVIVAEQMQDAVHHQMRHVVGGRFLLRLCLTPHGLPRQHDVAQEGAVARGIGEHIGRPVFPAVAPVERAHGLVVGEGDRQGPAASRRCARRPADQPLDTRQRLDPRFIEHNDGATQRRFSP